MKNIAKITALIICVLFAVIIIVSCNGVDDKDSKEDIISNDVKNTANDNPEGPIDDVLARDNVPDLDFEGYEYRVVFGTFGDISGVYFYPEAEEGEVLNDTIYRRNIKIEERFNVKFKADPVEGGGAALLAKNVKAGDDAYDMYMVVDREAHTASENNYLYPLNEVPYIDLARPYWMQEVNRLISVGGKLSYAFSDEVLSVFENTIVMFYNKKMAQDLQLEDFYALVRTGDWTMDKFFEYAKAGIKNVGGSGEMTKDDNWGIVADTGLFYSFWINAGINTVEKDEDDIPYFNLPGNERFFASGQKVYDYITGTDGIYGTAGQLKLQGENGANAEIVFFKNGQALFVADTIQEMINLRDMDDDFGVLPFPKYDAAQERYYSRLGGGRPFVIPNTNQRPDIAGAIMESMACETRNTVFPAYYEFALKNKFSRDPETCDMLDLIRDTSTWDIGCITWGSQIGGPLVNIFASGKNTLASWVEKNQDKIGVLIQKSVDAILAD